jgi:hypothetical protein
MLKYTDITQTTYIQSCIGGWVGPRAGLDGSEKSRPPSGFDPRTVRAVANRSTDLAIPASGPWMVRTIFLGGSYNLDTFLSSFSIFVLYFENTISRLL